MNIPSYNTEQDNSNKISNSGTASCALGATGINPIACRRDHF